MLQMRDAIVVGGGLAGITAALALRDSGEWNVKLFEAGRALGGRVSSVVDKELGIKLDNCQHACFRVYDHFLQLIKRCNAQKSIKFQKSTLISFTNPNSGITGKLYDSRLKPPNQMLKSILKFPHLTFKDKFQMRKVVKKLSKMTEDERIGLDNIPFDKWLLDNGQTQNSIDVFWGFFVLAALNTSISKASTAQAAFLFRRGLFGKSDAFDVGVFSEELSFIFENQILNTLIKSGIEVFNGTKVDSLIWNGEKCTGINTSTKDYHADTVILATPHNIARKMLKNGPDVTKGIYENLCKMKFNSLIGIHGLYSKKITDDDFHFTALINEPIIQIVFNRNFELDQSISPDVKQWLSVPVSYADEYIRYSKKELEKEYVEVINKLWPEHKKYLTKVVIIKIPNATFSTETGTNQLRPDAEEVVPGLLLCGDYMNNGWPSVMEGAVTSGLMTAANILKINSWEKSQLWADWPEPPKRGDINWREV